MFRLSLPDDPARAVLLGVKMVWETPTYSESRMTAGIGFAFDTSNAAGAFKQHTERILTDVLLNTPQLHHLMASTARKSSSNPPQL